MLRDADTAMYRAKAKGKDRYEVFDDEMRAAALRLLHTEVDLRNAVKLKQLAVWYQPIVDLRTGTVSGFEALVRWTHPDRGLISPADFVPVAEETGLIGDIGQFVLEEAVGQLARWRREFPTHADLGVSVNVSGKQFGQTDLVQKVAGVLETVKLPPEALRLEITESAVITHVEQAESALRRLREMGIAIYMDDFGTGVSSLSRLRSMPIDVLKIDRSFVKNLSSDPDDVAFVKMILALASHQRLGVIAEGVEQPEDLALLRELGCPLAQGYLFARPVDAVRVRELLAEEPRW